jgi:hypothetical protein
MSLGWFEICERSHGFTMASEYDPSLNVEEKHYTSKIEGHFSAVGMTENHTESI